MSSLMTTYHNSKTGSKAELYQHRPQIAWKGIINLWTLTPLLEVRTPIAKAIWGMKKLWISETNEFGVLDSKVRVEASFEAVCVDFCLRPLTVWNVWNLGIVRGMHKRGRFGFGWLAACFVGVSLLMTSVSFFPLVVALFFIAEFLRCIYIYRHIDCTLNEVG